MKNIFLRSIGAVSILVSIVILSASSYAMPLTDEKNVSVSRGEEKEVSITPLPKVRLLMIDGLLDDYRSPDIYAPLPDVLKRFDESYRVRVIPTGLSQADYERDIFKTLRAEDAPHIFLAPAELAPELVARKSVIPLDRWADANPDIIKEIPPSVLARFTARDKVYGIPVWGEGKLANYAYMVSAAAKSGSVLKNVYKLLTVLKKEIPLRGLPDLTIDHISVTRKGATPPSDEIVTHRPTAGDTVVVKAVVTNLGEAPAYDVPVIFSTRRSKEPVTQYLKYVAPGRTETLEIAFTFIERPGTPPEDSFELIDIVIDPEHTIPEAARFNNRLLERINPSDLGALLPPAPNVTGQPFVIDPYAFRADVMGMGPKAASDGAKFFVVWAHQDVESYNPYSAYNHQLYGAIISSDGVVEKTFTIADEKGKYNSYNIAFDGFNYLVVWEREYWNQNWHDPASIIAAARVASDGTVLDQDPLIIDDTDAYGWRDKLIHEAPDVIFDGHQFFVTYRTLFSSMDNTAPVYPDSMPGIYAKQVFTNGTVNPVKAGILEFGHTLHTGYDSQPSGFQRISYTDRKALLAFDGFDWENNAYGIYAIWLDFDGLGNFLAGDPAWLTGGLLGGFGSGYFTYPVVSSASNTQFMVAWEDTSHQPGNTNEPELYRARAVGVQNGGGILKQPAPLVEGASESLPEIAFDGKNYTVVYSHLQGCHSYVGAVRVTPNNVAGYPTYYQFPSTPTMDLCLVGNVDAAFNNTKGLVVFTNSYYGAEAAEGIYGVLIDKSQ